MIQKCRSLARADAVLSLVMAEERLRNVEATVDAFQNCREQGYMICFVEDDFDKAFYITECRNSDDMVVYVGKYAPHSMTDDAYNNGHYFRTEGEAADFLIKELKTLQRKQLLKRLNERNEVKAAQ
jgi:hypothetical protein